MWGPFSCTVKFWQAAAYPAALCLGLGVLLLLRDYRRFRRVHEAYRRLEQLPELTREQLPQGKSQTEWTVHTAEKQLIWPDCKPPA